MSDSDSERAHKTAERLKRILGQDPGVFEIQPTNRFGDFVVTIGCVSEEKRERVERAIIRGSGDSNFYFHSPIWPIGGLVPGSTEKFEERLQDSRNVTYGTKEWEETEKIQKDLIRRDVELWASWSQDQRRKFIGDRIKKVRKRIKGYANCGDKFLLPD